MLKEFAEKERLKDHLLYIIKQDHKGRVDTKIIEPASEILMRVFGAYEEILEEEDADAAGNYLFNIMASYVLVSAQLIDINQQLIDTNVELLDRLEDKD